MDGERNSEEAPGSLPLGGRCLLTYVDVIMKEMEEGNQLKMGGVDE